MHTTKMLQTADFSITIEGEDSTFDDLFPDFSIDDRVAFVLRSPGAGVVISGMILATITRHYDFWRADGSDFWLYPEFYIVHVGGERGFHGNLDIWPQHKEVVIDAQETERVLTAINDRAVTRLVVEEGPSATRPLLRETLAAARRIKTALAFSPSGKLTDADVTLHAPPAVEELVRRTLVASLNVPEPDLRAREATRRAREVQGQVVEEFRRISVPAAIGMLSGRSSEPTSSYGFSPLYSEALELTADRLGRHEIVFEPPADLAAHSGPGTPVARGVN